MSEKKIKYPSGKHPNSLAALTSPPWNSETAKEAQLLGAKKRSENARKRNEIKEKLKMLKQMEKELQEDKIDSVEVLRLIAYEKLEEGDSDAAVEIFKSIAEFEKPKLARVESRVEEVKTDDMTDEELHARLVELARKAD